MIGPLKNKLLELCQKGQKGVALTLCKNERYLPAISELTRCLATTCKQQGFCGRTLVDNRASIRIAVIFRDSHLLSTDGLPQVPDAWIEVTPAQNIACSLCSSKLGRSFCRCVCCNFVAHFFRSLLSCVSQQEEQCRPQCCTEGTKDLYGSMTVCGPRSITPMESSSQLSNVRRNPAF